MNLKEAESLLKVIFVSPPTNEIVNIYNKVSGKTNKFTTKEESDNNTNPLLAISFTILFTISIIVIYYVMYYYAMKFVCASGMNVGEYFLAMCCTLPYVIIKLLMGSSNKSKSV
jgi:hypothetical protein